MASPRFQVARQPNHSFNVNLTTADGRLKTIPGFGSEHEAAAWIVQTERMLQDTDPALPPATQEQRSSLKNPLPKNPLPRSPPPRPRGRLFRRRVLHRPLSWLNSITILLWSIWRRTLLTPLGFGQPHRHHRRPSPWQADPRPSRHTLRPPPDRHADRPADPPHANPDPVCRPLSLGDCFRRVWATLGLSGCNPEERLTHCR